MPEFSKSIHVDVEPRRLFDYLSDVGNLPRYMPRLSHAEPAGDDGAVQVTAHPKLPDGRQVEVKGTAWTRVDELGRRFSWGSVGSRNNYRGTFDIDPVESGSQLTVTIVSERADGAAVQTGLGDTLASIKNLVEQD
ncbi:SRPBCC family protein [Gephyromycinifex aptenodytis]|uniref:SRPBCC family protein n=1 Tax=Gephyromycinifex aptenodytis TaxID=2716227 RepID=UPI0014452E1F|nr:SRPBCC family protein [Gephyromycinifex aptenodytis]